MLFVNAVQMNVHLFTSVLFWLISLVGKMIDNVQ